MSKRDSKHKHKNHHHHKKHVDQALILSIGKWKNGIPEDHLKDIIAKALNECTREDQLTIKGYIITRRRIGLIVGNTEEEMKHILKNFCGNVGELVNYYRDSLDAFINPCSHEDTTFKNLIVDTHFRLYPFYDRHLKSLLLGQEPDIKYYSSHLAKLKYKVQNYKYCSAIDYSGAKSPVMVTQEKSKNIVGASQNSDNPKNN